MDGESAAVSDAPLFEVEIDEGWAGFASEDYEASKKAQIGWKSIVIALFVGLMTGLAIWSSLSAGANISPSASFLVFGLVAVALAGFAFAPAVLESLGGRASALNRVGRAFYFLAIPVLFIDKALRGPIASVCGLRVHHPAPRYALLFLHIGLAASLVWIVPRYWPEGDWLGYVGLTWALTALIAVVREWTWIENQYERRAAGFDGLEAMRFPQLRDEALTAVLIFFFCVPVILWKLDGSFHLFEPADGGAVAPLDWIALFGGELVKAIPLVDWAEVYDVDSRNILEPLRPFGQTAVFATRVIVDLVLIGALLYAIERVGQISRQWQEFLGGRRRLLDPFLEHRVFRVLKKQAGEASWFESKPAYSLGPFARYDAGRLRAMALKEEDDPVHVAIVLHAAFAQDATDLLSPIARDLLQTASRRRSRNVNVLELAVVLLGAVQSRASRQLLGSLTDGFRAYAAADRERLLKKVADALSESWATLKNEEKTTDVGSEVVNFLRKGLNKGPNIKVRGHYADRLVDTRAGEALDAISEHLDGEVAASLLRSLAVDMQNMSDAAPPEVLRRAAAHSKRRVQKLLAQSQRNSADEQAITALNNAAEALERVASEKEGDATVEPRTTQLKPAD